MTRCGNCLFTDVTSDFGSEANTISYGPYDITLRESINELSKGKMISRARGNDDGMSNGKLDILN